MSGDNKGVDNEGASRFISSPIINIRVLHCTTLIYNNRKLDEPIPTPSMTGGSSALKEQEEAWTEYISQS